MEPEKSQNRELHGVTPGIWLQLPANCTVFVSVFSLSLNVAFQILGCCADVGLEAATPAQSAKLPLMKWYTWRTKTAEEGQ